MSSQGLDQKSNGPIPAFDHQLKTLSDSYIAFMQERIRIEEAYVEGLLRLHRNTRALDNLLDDRDPSSIRVAWRELRDNLEREAETRSAFANTLKKDIQERTRKRIKEDIKESALAHQEYVENVLPRLKRNYLRKCQEVEEYKSADRASTSTSGTAAATNLSDAAVSPSPRRSSFEERERMALSNVISPTPSTTSQTGPRNRSPTVTGTSLSDLAHQGKKGLNQLIGFLDQNRERAGAASTARESADRTTNGLRGIRAKKEAEEADKEYRKGVHWLETLRLRRVKILQAGYNSLILFVGESGEVMSKALQVYVDCVTSTTSTCASLASYAQTAVAKISTNTDLDRVKNFVALVDYATARNMNNEAPSIVLMCIREVEARGMDAEGIYRVSGRHAAVQELTHKIERNERAFQFNPITEDVYAVSGLLKLYLRELPEPVFRFPLQERLHHSEDREEHISNGFLILKSKIRRLPPVHQVTLRVLVEHLARVAANSPQNKMDARNLAIVFGSVIFGEDEVPRTGDILSITTWKDTVMEDLITFSVLLFDDLHHSKIPSSASTSYSGKETGTLALPLPAQYPGKDQDSTPTLLSRPQYFTKDEDFAPTLPLHPQNSIHPSRRAVTANPSLLDNVASSDASLGSPARPTGNSFQDDADTPTAYSEQTGAHQGSPDLSDPFAARESPRGVSRAPMASPPPSPSRPTHVT
ncbi:hypothetical protein BS47DRAFT_1374940 [Hydnum rufescens UP504]|uniref:Rho-GAP domain-containing protein n=1 Tax=Hydnum rufescens UP504 TaxID=1448309 RepID=A0A9P6B8U9_9AGAM|nr:hypothetical protein BS47DRAFT_1374940 [Hydnum rufescens UP504]